MRVANNTKLVIGTALGGTAVGAGLCALWLWSWPWAATATVVAAVLGGIGVRSMRTHDKKADFENRNVQQVLVAYRELADMVGRALGRLPADLSPSAGTLNYDADQGITPRDLADFSVQVGKILGEIVTNVHQSGCPLPRVCGYYRETKGRQDSFQEFFLKHQTFSEILHSFVALITNSTNDISAPLSQEILVIKKAVSQFVDDLMNWMETSQHRSNQEVSSIIQHFSTHTEKIAQISSDIQHYNKSFRDDLQMVVNQFTLIQERTGRISEISEQVKMLSLNAAIQAARAGTAGKGFKVISAEIQKLSIDVQEMVELITTNITETTQSLRTFLERLDRDTEQIGSNLTQFNSELSQYDGNLEAYHKAFSDIVHTITTVSTDLQKHISNLTPLFQLQDMTVQQVEHLAVLSDRMEEVGSSNTEPLALAEDHKTDIRLKMFSLLEQVATTDGELAVLDRLVQRHKIQHSRRTRAPETVKIELF